MGIFDKIKNAIWGSDDSSASKQTASTSATRPVEASAGSVSAPMAPRAPTTPPPSTPAATSTASAAPAPGTTTPPSTGSAATPGSTQTAASAPAQSVDVAAMLDNAVKAKGQKLDWRHSIVDLMKALGMESSLAERKELAHELNYTGDTSDSAKMNMWLHKALLKKLSENGGKVPAELLD